MRWRGVGAMGGVGGGGWGVGVVPIPTIWSGERSTLELSGVVAVRVERSFMRQDSARLAQQTFQVEVDSEPHTLSCASARAIAPQASQRLGGSTRMIP
jgi:hypothetical protein